MHKHLVVLITAPSHEVGKAVASVLIEKRLAACVNITGAINSLYFWEGKVEDDEEVLLIAKTRADIFDDKFVPAVIDAHPYDVPEIIALPIVSGSKDYLDWIDDEVTA